MSQRDSLKGIKLSAHHAVGIRLERKKDASLLNWNLKRPYTPEKVCISLPATAYPCVRAGNHVETGQKIAEPAGPGCSTVHASMEGVVEKISLQPDALGNESMTIEICREGDPKPAPTFGNIRKDWEFLEEEELLTIFQDSGLVTTDVLMQPVHAKIKRSERHKTLVINGCEPEPYATCEQVLTMAHPVEILKGAEILKKAARAEKIFFVFEDCNLELIELIKSKIYFLKWEHIEVRTVPATYPQGLESLLLQTWFSGEEEKAIVFPASTAFAVYEAVVYQKPLYERVLTVGGECVIEPRSLWLPFGISFEDAIHLCKGLMREPSKVIMGGPMAGTAQKDLKVSVMPGTNAILALPKEVTQEETEEPCIRCNLCAEMCPVHLSPAMITLAAEQNEFELARQWDVFDCIECGNCAYICPSKRPMLKLIRKAQGNKSKALAAELERAT